VREELEKFYEEAGEAIEEMERESDRRKRDSDQRCGGRGMHSARQWREYLRRFSAP
jgi:hypothetical protein